MKLIICGFFILLMASAVIAQNDSSIIIHGEIVNIKDEPLPFTHVKVKKSLKGTITNIHGEYNLRVKPLDAVIISCVGYKTAMFYIPESISNDFSNKTILIRDTILLDEAIISPWPGTYTKLKEEFKKISISDTAHFGETKRFVLDDSEINEYKSLGSDGNPAITLPGPISLLHNAFGDKPKQYRKLEKDKLQSVDDRIATRKLNKEIIRKLTGLENDLEIEEFIKYCEFSTEFLVNTSIYNIAIKIGEKYEEYLRNKMND